MRKEDDKYRCGDVVYYKPLGERVGAVKAVVLAQRFNNGNGGFYDIRIEHNSSEKTVHYTCLWHAPEKEED